MSNYKYGTACKHTDMNGNVMTTKLDNQGRVVSITGPNEQGKDTATIQFEYHPQLKDANGNKQTPYAITKHYDPANPKNYLETVTFVDGVGRAIQVKKDGFVNGQEVSLVGGRVKYDAFGRVKVACNPTVEALANKYVFNAAFDSTDSHLPTTRTSYDVLDRVTRITMPDGSYNTMAYSIENNLLKTTATDALKNIQETYANGSGKTVKSVQYNKDTALITRFHYDAIEQLDSVTDTKGKKTITIYDLAGRPTQITHPASGITKFGYDAAGNKIWEQTANLIPTGKKIQYFYTFNRLDSVSYPNHPENNVKMVYGTASEADSTHGYRAGRLKYQEDGSGGQEFWYGKMGEVKQVRRTLVIPNQAVATYDTKWTYDSWNRLQTMTYPDGEVLNYKYNLGGLLWQVQGTKSGATYNYVDSIKYDKFEQRTRLRYGNGAVTTFVYNDSTRRLQNLGVLSTRISKQIMNNAYKFDRVGNIVNVRNTGVSIPSVNTISGNIGGTMEHTYTYDNLYRLVEAHGDFNKQQSKSAHYDLYMGYDNMYNVVSKKQYISQTGVQFKDSLYAGYDLAYQINAGNSQQIDTITDVSYRYAQGEKKVEDNKVSLFSYDANGNLLSILTGTKQGDKLLATNGRRLLWDEENRMLASSDNGYVTSYFYDASGERTVKMSGDAEGININGLTSGERTGITNFTAYINPYLIVRKGGEYTKHIYIGGQRITSKVGNSGMFNAATNPLTLDKANKVNFAGKQNLLTAKIKERYDSLGVAYTTGVQSGNLTSKAPSDSTSSYFYHNDHLGSSSLITDANGDIVQHIEYVPYGGTFIDERRSASSWHTPFLFSGKERDEETGLLYVSQRYQDEKYCIWYGVDPLAEEFPNVSSYVYCHNNPVNMVDPDGRGDYYTNQGKWLGQDKNVNDNKVYRADSRNDDGTFKNAEDLKVGHDVFIGLAAAIHQESSGNKEESLRIGNAHMNFLAKGGSKNLKTLEDIVMYDNTIVQGATADGYEDFNKLDKSSQNSKYALGSAVNALGYSNKMEGFKDYSNGADAWDGIDLICSKNSNDHRTWTWSSDSKGLLLDYKNKFKGGVDVLNFKFSNGKYDIKATSIVGKTIFESYNTPRGGKKQSLSRFTK
ncbi:MAG TPA: RHS repeat-associated core domain-containing protein [Paludibacter sp.]|nr:RHS repeat-associated core domain-containing protein [Paludibacter sp.]